VELLRGEEMNRRSDTRIHVSPALIVACIALAVSLGGTGYAALKLPAGSVGTAQLKKNAVTSPKVKNASLLAADFKPGQLPAGPPGPQGAKGDPGAAGATGPRGPSGLSALEVVTASTPVDTTSPKVKIAACPAGKKAVGGGHQLGGATPAGMVSHSSPEVDLSGWRALGKWPTGVFPSGWQIVVYAVCATVAP
jgi:hypothetical protein